MNYGIISFLLNFTLDIFECIKNPKKNFSNGAFPSIIVACNYSDSVKLKMGLFDFGKILNDQFHCKYSLKSLITLRNPILYIILHFSKY